MGVVVGLGVDYTQRVDIKWKRVEVKGTGRATREGRKSDGW